MTTIQTELPESIRATIHQDAISRVPSFFNATTTDILNELLQNARRSGASRVDATARVNREAQAWDITLQDDGQGIRDPRAILAFGQSGWEERRTLDEHPAGMGIYALARSEDVEIASKTKDGTAWRVRLGPGHFTGAEPAAVERLDGTETKTGTSVTFRSKNYWEGDLARAVRHYPVPVYLNGTRLDAQDFLEGAERVEHWQGARIGVFKGYDNRLNFHGIVVNNPNLPSIRTIESAWSARVDVQDCPHIELTLPARKEVVETPFMERLRHECRRIILRAMSRSQEPVDVPKRVQDQARLLGITLPDARPMLTGWEPEKADYRQTRDKKRTELPERPLLIGPEDLNTPDQQVLNRAAQEAGLKDRIVLENPDLRGYQWYDRLESIGNVEILLDWDGEETELQELRARKPEHRQTLDPRPDRITLALEILDQEGEELQEIRLEGDVALLDAELNLYDYPDPLVTKDSSIGVKELRDLMIDAYFNPSDDSGTDSHNTQEADHKETYEQVATDLLVPPDQALIASLRKAAEKQLIHQVPVGHTATLTISRPNLHHKNLDITVGQLEEGTEECAGE